MAENASNEVQHIFAACATACNQIYAECLAKSLRNHADAVQKFAVTIIDKLKTIRASQTGKNASRDELLQTISWIRGMLNAVSNEHFHLLIIAFGADHFEDLVLSQLIDTCTLQLFFQRLHVLRVLVCKLRTNLDECACWRNESAALKSSWIEFVSATYARVLDTIVFKFATSYLVGVSESVSEVFREIVQTSTVAIPGACDYEHVIESQSSKQSVRCNSFFCRHIASPLVSMPFTKGFLRIWQRALPIFGATKFLRLVPDFSTRLKDALENSNEAHVAGDFYAALLTLARSEFDHSVVSVSSFWTTHFLESICSMLFNASSTCRLNCVQCILPDTIRMVAGAFSILLERAETVVAQAGEEPEGLESALVVICALHRLVRISRADQAADYMLTLGASDDRDRVNVIERFIESSTLRRCIVHESELVRLEAFSFVCQSIRSTERISSTEWQLALSFLLSNLRTSNASYRRRVTYNFKVLLGRMRLTVVAETVSDYIDAFRSLISAVRSLVLVRRPAGNVATGDYLDEKAVELRSLDESTYQRERAFIDALRELLAAFPKADFDAHSANNTPASAVESNAESSRKSRKFREQKTRGNSDALRAFYSESNRALLYSGASAEWLIGLLTCSFFTDVQHDAATILVDTMADGVTELRFADLVDRAFRLANSAPQKHFLAGSELMRVVLARQPGNQSGFGLAGTEAGERQSTLLKRIYGAVTDCFDAIERVERMGSDEIGRMSVESTALGLLVTLKDVVCSQPTSAVDTDQAYTLLRRTVAHVNNLLKLFGVSSRADCDCDEMDEQQTAELDVEASANPSFADLSVALSRLVVSDGDAGSETVKLSTKYQFVSSLVWHQVRYSLELLVALVSLLLDRAPQAAATRELVESANGAFVRVLLECRHIGVIASVGVAYRGFCETLLRCDVSDVIESTFVDVLASVANDSFRFNITRRSAGLPQLIRAIWLAFRTRRTARSTFLQRAVEMWIGSLTACCQRILNGSPQQTAEPNVMVERDSSATHLLNVLHFMLRNEACLIEAFEAHFDELFALAARLFTAPRSCAVPWPVLNSAQQLLAVVACRMLGDKRVLQLNDSMESCSALTAHQFFSHFPLAINTIIQLLGSGASRSVIPALLILAKMNGAKVKFGADASAKQLVRFVFTRQLVNHGSFLVRSLWSKAVFTLLPRDLVLRYIVRMLSKLPSANQAVSVNATHSILLLTLEYTRRHGNDRLSQNAALLPLITRVLQQTKCDTNRAVCFDLCCLLVRGDAVLQQTTLLEELEKPPASNVHGLLNIAKLKYLLVAASSGMSSTYPRVSSLFTAFFDDMVRREDVFLAEKLSELLISDVLHETDGLQLLTNGCFATLSSRLVAVSSKRFLFSLFGFLRLLVQLCPRCSESESCGRFYSTLVANVLRPRPVRFLPHVSRGLLLATLCCPSFDKSSTVLADWLTVVERLQDDLLVGIGAGASNIVGYDEQREAFCEHLAESCWLVSRSRGFQLAESRRMLGVLLGLVTSRFANDVAKQSVARTLAALSGNTQVSHYPDALRGAIGRLERFFDRQPEMLGFLVELLSTVCASIRQEVDARGLAKDESDPVLYEHEQMAANDDVLFVLELIVERLKTAVAGSVHNREDEAEVADYLAQLKMLRTLVQHVGKNWNSEYMFLLSSLFDSSFL